NSNDKNWEAKKLAVKKQIEWILGEEPAGVKASPIENLTSKEDYVTSFLNRPRLRNGKVEHIAPYNGLGDYLHASLYYPVDKGGGKVTGPTGKMPVVIFLHKFSNTGFDSGLNSLFEDILSKGVAVLAMDLIGYGTRIEAGT